MIIKSLDEIAVAVTEQEILAYIEERKESYRDSIALHKFMGQLLDEFAKIESRDVRVSDMVMNGTTFANFRRLIGCPTNPSGRDNLHLETNRENLRRGILAMLWGARIWVIEIAPDTLQNNEIIFYGENDPAFSRDFPAFAGSLSAEERPLCVDPEKLQLPSEPTGPLPNRFDIAMEHAKPS